jgi:aminopeptidase C
MAEVKIVYKTPDETWKTIPQCDEAMFYHKNAYINFHVANQEAVNALNFPEKRANYAKAYTIKMRDRTIQSKSLTKYEIEEINKQETLSINELSEWICNTMLISEALQMCK